MFPLIRVALLTAAASLFLSSSAQSMYMFELETTNTSSTVIGTGYISLPSADGDLADIGGVAFNFSGAGLSWAVSDITGLQWMDADTDLVLSLFAQTNPSCASGGSCENRTLNLNVNNAMPSGVGGGYVCGDTSGALCDAIWVEAGAVTTATRVPVPTALALFSLGLVGLRLARRAQPDV